MDRIDAINYLADTGHIPVRDMDKAMFRFLRAASRRAGRLSGYYDPEFDGKRAKPEALRFRPAIWSETLPQCAALRAKIVSKIPDPFADHFSAVRS